MKKYSSLPVVLLLYLGGSSQKDINGLVNAEKSFAAYSVAHGIKPAFLGFADSIGIMFDKQLPVNAIHLWNSREDRAGVLNWYPYYAEIANSKDFGYTTGPWTFQPQTIRDSIIATGRFITIWQINKTGEWKFLIDLGVNNVPRPADSLFEEIKRSDPSFRSGSMRTLLKSERAFIKAAHKSVANAYKQFLSDQTIVNRNGLKPARTIKELNSLINSQQATIDFEVNGSGMASSGDLGYAYGELIVSGKKENYLRIWRKEKKGWKIALEVVRL